jgi:hypothetical protein
LILKSGGQAMRVLYALRRLIISAKIREYETHFKNWVKNEYINKFEKRKKELEREQKSLERKKGKGVQDDLQAIVDERLAIAEREDDIDKLGEAMYSAMAKQVQSAVDSQKDMTFVDPIKLWEDVMSWVMMKSEQTKELDKLLKMAGPFDYDNKDKPRDEVARLFSHWVAMKSIDALREIKADLRTEQKDELTILDAPAGEGDSGGEALAGKDLHDFVMELFDMAIEFWSKDFKTSSQSIALAFLNEYGDEYPMSKRTVENYIEKIREISQKALRGEGITACRRANVPPVVNVYWSEIMRRTAAFILDDSSLFDTVADAGFMTPEDAVKELRDERVETGIR